MWCGRAVLRRAVSKSVGEGAEQTFAWGEQRRGGAFETEETDAEESRLCSVLPLQTSPAQTRSRVRETHSYTAGKHTNSSDPNHLHTVITTKSPVSH